MVLIMKLVVYFHRSYDGDGDITICFILLNVSVGRCKYPCLERPSPEYGGATVLLLLSRSKWLPHRGRQGALRISLQICQMVG